ncbi:ATP-binding cassette domain-containing protein [Nonomuraea sp. NPDC049400]|uniref:ATP-binding cassette domain-containing protein n=1 Tax=Nonomuraea sp. NPDC049400 TaxID=3364352 RepID=UPI0037B1C447
MIEFDHVSKFYKDVKALDDVSFTAEAGSITGFLWPNGAGKSTAMRILVGLSRPTSGSATVLGRPYTELGCPGSQVGVLLTPARSIPAGPAGRRSAPYSP